MSKICFGEFDYPTGESQKLFLRNKFLETVENLAQEACADLYQSIQDPTIQAYESWACRYHLNTPWVMRVVSSTVLGWLFHKQDPDDLKLARIPVNFILSLAKSIKPPRGFHQYKPVEMSRSWYLEWSRRTVEDVIANSILNVIKKPKKRVIVRYYLEEAEAYCLEVERRYEDAGYSPCRANKKRNLQEHLNWTVRFQVRGESFMKISDTANVEVSTVKRGVDDLLRLLDLPKRPTHRKEGRTRKRETKNTSRIPDEQDN